MSVVDIHPEQLFDHLRAGELSAAERTRLVAHCTRCTACLFELRWVEAWPLSLAPSAEDHAFVDAAYDAGPRVSALLPDIGWRPLLGIAGLLLAVGASIGWFVPPSGQTQAQVPRPVPAVTISLPCLPRHSSGTLAQHTSAQ